MAATEKPGAGGMDEVGGVKEECWMGTVKGIAAVQERTGAAIYRR